MRKVYHSFFSKTCNQVFSVSDFNFFAHTVITDIRLFFVTESLTKKIIIKNLLITDSTKMIYY